MIYYNVKPIQLLYSSLDGILV